MVTILTQYDSPNYTPANQMTYVGTGEPRVVTSFTGHHWNTPGMGDTFDGTINELCRPGVQKSAHFVVEGSSHGHGNRAACLVSPNDAAWSTGNWHGNASTVAFEMNPDECDSCYQAAGELLAELIPAYGFQIFHPHNYWVSTQCPGSYDLPRIYAIARAILGNPRPVPPKPITPPTQKDEFDMATLDQLRALLIEPAFLNKLADTILDRPVDLVDSTALTGAVTGKTTLRRKVEWMAHNDAQTVNVLASIRSTVGVIQKGLVLPPATAPSAAQPVKVTS